MPIETITLFRPVGQKELDLIRESGFREFPPRLSTQPIFYPVLNEEYAVQIARDWNTKDETSGFAGWVTEFEVEDQFVCKYPVQVAGRGLHRELWVPAEELDDFNKHIVGDIRVTEAFVGARFAGRLDPVTRLPLDMRD